MSRRLPALALLLCLPFAARAAEIRLAVPAAFADDSFLKTFAASGILASAGLSVTLKPVENDGAVMAALDNGTADLGAFSLDNEDLRALRGGSPETSLLSRPFLFRSAQEVTLMQDSFLGSAAAADAGRSGLFPIRIWTHSIAYLLTREPIRTEADFRALKIAAENGYDDARLLSAASAAGAQSKPASAQEMPAEGKEMPAGGMDAMMQGDANALETPLDAPALAMASAMKGKLYLTVGRPETALLAAAPAFWTSARAIDKNAVKTAAEQARAAADAELMTKEKAIEAMPNVEISPLDHDARMALAMRAGGGAADSARDRELWRKAEVEVHGQPASTPTPAAGPKPDFDSPVFFATDRNDEGGADYTARFGARRNDPGEIACGPLGAPRRGTESPLLPPAPARLTTGVAPCARAVVEAARKAGATKILVLIHGFNTSFSDVAQRALTLGASLDYAGAVLAWSWPSEGSAFSYAYDEDSNAWSEPHLSELVMAMAALAPDIQFDFVAHSMGNRILVQMLREFALAHVEIRIGAAVFAAPDVSQDVFREWMRQAGAMGSLRTLYASEYDRAILISESYHKAPRAGSGGGAILVTKGVESIDAQLGGHSYVFDEPKALQDFRQVVNGAVAAPKRGLAEHEKAGAAYWVIAP
jgi:esterase/lipase superfamily enzyme/TRAP-type C4-dicarboxylate transport system substrate-binding protein